MMAGVRRDGLRAQGAARGATERAWPFLALACGLLLAGCRPTSKDDPPASSAEDPPDSAAETAGPAPADDTARPGETGGGEDSGGEGDDGAWEDRGVPWLSSDREADPGSCGEVQPFCDAGTCTVDVALHTVALAGRFSPGPGWGLRFTRLGGAWDTLNPVAGSSWAGTTPFGSYTVWPEADTFTTRVFTGDWRVTLVDGERNATARGELLVADTVSLDADTPLDVTPAWHHVSGTVGLGGATPSEYGRVTLTNATTGDWRSADVYRGAFATDLPDGAWTATYRPDDTLPDGTFPAGELRVSGADVTADLEIEAAAFHADVTIGGAPLAEKGYSGGWEMTFVGTGGARFRWYYAGGERGFDTWLPPDHYDVVLVQPQILVGDDVAVEEGATLTLSEANVSVRGTLTWAGDAGAGWSMRLDEPTLGVSFRIEDPVWSASMPPGVYDLTAERTAGAVVRARVASGVPIAGGRLDLRTTIARIGGPLRWNGHGAAEADVVLFDPDLGRMASVRPCTDRWRMEVPVGTYDVYVGQPDDAYFGVAPYARVARGLAVTGSRLWGLAVTTRPVTLTATIDGAPTEGRLLARSEAWGDTLAASGRDDEGLRMELPDGIWSLILDSVDVDGVAALLPVAECGAVE